MMNAYSQAKSSLQAKWQPLHERDKNLLRIAFGVLVLLLVWWTLLATPLRILSQADAQQRSLDAQLQAVQNLKAQAQNLQARPAIKRDAVLAALQAFAKPQTAHTQLDVSSERVTLTLRAIPANALAQWLALARTDARALPLEARLQRTAGAEPTWDGILVFGLPAPQ